MLDLNALAPVSPQEFSTSEDLPIRQILRRFGERRLGEVQESNALTGLQERLALLMEARARRSEQPLTFFGDGAGQSGRRSLHLDVGARYLPLKVDVGFGRYGDFQAQTLFPTGGGQYRLDAALLKLWVEEEIQAMEQPWVEAQVATQALVSAQARPVAALPSPDRAARPAASPSVAASVPPAVRDALEPRRQELRRAMLQAVQGDVRELARLTHGTEVQAILGRLQARAAQQAATRAPASAQGEPLAAGQARPLDAQDQAHLAPTALRMEDVAQLRPFLPTLSVDAADPSFSFERAAETILQSARGLAARAARGEVLGLSESKAHALVGAQAHEAGRFAQHKELSRARMFGVGAAEVQAVEAMARAMTPFAHTSAAPHLPALRAIEQAPGSAPQPGKPALGEVASSLSSSIAAALEPQGAPRRALGELGLKALELRPAAPKERAARRWLMDGGRGVLLDGLDGAGPSRKPTAAPAQPWEAAEQPSLGSPSLGAPSAIAPSVVAPSLTGNSAPARGLAAVLETLTPPSLWQPSASYPAGVSARALGAWTPELALPSVERRAAGSPRASEGAGHPSYDATARGDFASVVARAQLLPWTAAPHAAAQAAARLDSRFAAGDPQRSALPAGVLSQGGAASTGELGAEPSRQPLTALASEGAWSPMALSGAQGLGATPAEILIQDVAVSGRYLPSLARALEQIGHSAERAARLLPGALGRGAHPDGSLGLAEAATGREVGSLGRLHEALRAVRAGLQDAQVLPGRLAELATRFAEVVREGQEAGLRGPSEPRRGYQTTARWAQDLTPLRMEALAQPKAAALLGEGWSAQAAAQFVAQAQAQVQHKATEQIARLSQVVSQPQAREEAPRALGMFSPEKTLSMLAPQLESGGLLDATSRRELSAALESLSHAPSAQPRRVRTPFGTLSVKLVGGQVVVDAEEASSLSPSVGLSRRAVEAQQVGVTAPTRQVEALAAFASQAGSAARMAQGEASAWQRLGGAPLGALARQALGAVEGVELLLGGPARAERGAGVVLEPVAGRGAEGLAGLVAARGAQALGSTQGLGSAQARGAVRHEQAGEVIRVHAGSQRTAEVLQALRRRGLVVSDEAQGGLEQVLGAAPSESLGAQARVVAGGRLAELLARSEGASALRAADLRSAGDLRLSGEGQPAAVEAAGQRPLDRLLAEAADARAIGALGKVGMARPAFGALTRADLAHVLPFLQREATLVGAGRAQGEALGAELASFEGAGQPQGAGLEALLRRAGTTPEVLSRALGLASVAELAQAAQRMGLSGVGVGPSAEAMPSLRAVGRPIGGSEAVGTLGERLEQPSRSSWSRVPSPETTLVQAQARVEGEQARLDRISRRLEGRPSRQPLQAQALSGVLLRELSGVRELVEQLGGPQPQRLKARLEAAGFAPSRGGERGDLVQLAGLRGVVGERAAQDAGASVESRAGRVGIWMPLGVERLVAEGAETLVGAQGGFEGAFVAPRLFQAAGQRAGARGSAAASLAGRAPWREVGGRMGLGLVDLKPGTLGGPFLGGGDGVGELPAIGVGNSALNQAPWMTSTQALSRMEQIVHTLQQGAAAQQAVTRRSTSADLTLPSLPASPDAVISGRGAGGGAGGGYGDIPQPPRELYKPPYTAQAQAMPANQAQGGGAGAGAGSWGQPPGQQGFATPRASMDQQNAPEVRPERGGEHPYDAGEMPTQQHIEDLAHEVLETLKRKWAYELERRGTE